MLPFGKQHMFIDSFKQHFESVADPRQSAKVTYPFFDILFGSLLCCYRWCSWLVWYPWISTWASQMVPWTRHVQSRYSGWRHHSSHHFCHQTRAVPGLLSQMDGCCSHPWRRESWSPLMARHCAALITGKTGAVPFIWLAPMPPRTSWC